MHKFTRINGFRLKKFVIPLLSAWSETSIPHIREVCNTFLLPALSPRFKLVIARQFISAKPYWINVNASWQSRSSAIFGCRGMRPPFRRIGKPNRAHRKNMRMAARAPSRASAMSIYWNYRISSGNNTGFLFRGYRSAVPERISAVSENRRRTGSRTKEHATGQRAVAHARRLLGTHGRRKEERRREGMRGGMCVRNGKRERSEVEGMCARETCATCRRSKK